MTSHVVIGDRKTGGCKSIHQ